MPDFQLVSEKKPAGGQPEAIKKLIAGHKKYSRQTLLGITGAGKSLDYSEQILVRNAKGSIVKTEIGYFVEHHLTAPSRTGSTEFQSLEGYKILSFNPLTGETMEADIHQISRHQEQNVFEIVLDDNSSIKVTADHNCFRFKDGVFDLCETRELSVGDSLPLATSIPAPKNPVSHIDLWKYNRARNYCASELLLRTSHDSAAVGRIVHSRSPGWKLSQIYGATSNRGISISQANQLSVALQIPKPALFEQLKIITKGPDSVPARLPITDDLLTFCGLFVAEGHLEPTVIQISNQTAHLQAACKRWFDSIGLHYSQSDQKDIQYFSVAIANMMREFGTHAHNKHIPSWVFNLSDEHLGLFLRAAFDGDGWIEKNGSVCYLSKSKQLINDMRYLLLRFGITTRVLVKSVQQAKFWQICISGRQNAVRFRDNINFSIDYKQERLANSFNTSENMNVNLVPSSGVILKQIRRYFKLRQRDVADIIRCKQCYVSMVETEIREMSQELFSRIAAWAAARDPCFSYLRALTNFNFRKIKEINKVASSTGFVYDVAVKNTETFMAGFGGIFVHNTFMVANLIQAVNKPTLVLAHNKTLASQLYAELKELFPHNRVEYFVSYFDYYQPESYLPASDTYIEKDSSVNPQLERMRLQATASLFSRKDVIIVASVSCIYGLGDPKDYWNLSVSLEVGQTKSRDELLRGLVDMQYQRNDQLLEPGNFRVRGDTIDISPSYENERIVRVTLFGDEIESIQEMDRLNMTPLSELKEVTIFPAKHFVTSEEKLEKAITTITEELEETLPKLEVVERMRLEKRTKYDLAMIKELGYCTGIENYSRHFDGRKQGEPPFTLLDFFPEDFLFIVDESHVSLPQLHGMYKGDRSRKANLIEHGFRLESAFDNRPLKFEETEKFFRHTVFVSATPAEYERKTSGQLVECIIRPTGLLDPRVEVRPTKGQVQDIIKEVHQTIEKGWRVLVTTLTKKMAEDLTDYLGKEQLKVRYLHSEIDTLERTEIIRQLRLGTFDVLVGINLLREGLDIPETALVCILDADKEGFLRNETSLLQTIGRAARNADGRVIFYADRITDSMKRAIDVTHARRKAQELYNAEHKIIPKTIVKAVAEKKVDITSTKHLPKSDIPNLLIELQAAMDKASANLDFEAAIKYRDQIKKVEKEHGIDGVHVSDD